MLLFFHQFKPALTFSPPVVSVHSNRIVNQQPKIVFVLPTNKAFKGGQDIDGEKLFICRSHKYGQIIPGKYSRTIRKCSITHNRREAQFHRYEILIESGDRAYQWIELKKPVTRLPENVLFGGNKFGLPTTSAVLAKPRVINNITTTSAAAANFLLDGKGELNSRSVDLFLSSDQIWGSRKRRVRRSAVDNSSGSTTTTSKPTKDDTTDWSRNWRGNLYEGVERISSFTGPLRRRQKPQTGNDFNEVAVESNSKKRRCTPRSNNFLLLLTKLSSSSSSSSSKSSANDADDCLDEPQKANFYIAKCSLRTGNITSEQIGKIWWKEAIQEWVASFPFAGNEVPCFDYSVLTVKS